MIHSTTLSGPAPATTWTSGVILATRPFIMYATGWVSATSSRSPRVSHEMVQMGMETGAFDGPLSKLIPDPLRLMFSSRVLFEREQSSELNSA